MSTPNLRRSYSRVRQCPPAARGKRRWLLLAALTALILQIKQVAHAQTADSKPNTAIVLANPPIKQPPESEIAMEGLVSYGHYKIFASGMNCHLYTSGFEYDRHSWGSFLGAQVDYVAEFLPLVLLRTPDTTDIWGNPTTSKQKTVPGLEIAPIGFRMLWRSNKTWRPYLTAKGGVIAFPQKVLSQQATYENFSLQEAVGLQTRLTDKLDLRLGLFGDFHFSNAFIVPVNPGLDVMNATMAVSYHLGPQGLRGLWPGARRRPPAKSAPM